MVLLTGQRSKHGRTAIVHQKDDLEGFSQMLNTVSTTLIFSVYLALPFRSLIMVYFWLKESVNHLSFCVPIWALDTLRKGWAGGNAKVKSGYLGLEDRLR